MQLPPQAVIDAVLSSSTRIRRSVEIYEADGVTRWPLDTVPRLVDGQVTCDYSRDERRAFDLTLDNSDGVLTSSGSGDNFWYDKILKIFRGVEVDQPNRPPKIIIIGDYQGTCATMLKSMLATVGFDDVRINTLATSINDVTGYELVVSLGNAGDVPLANVCQQAYNLGIPVFTTGNEAGTASIPFYTTVAASSTRDPWLISPNAASVPGILTQGWQADSFGSSIPGYDVTGTLPTAGRSGLLAVSLVQMGATTGYTIGAEVNPNGNGGRWVHYHPVLVQTTNVLNFLKAAFSWLNPYSPIKTWDQQIGEFMIDKIDEGNFPHQLKVSGRDYTKKCLLSKFSTALDFATGSSLESLVGSIASNAGITKQVLPKTGITINRTFSYDKGTERWQAMKDIANAYNYDIWFDPKGFLQLSPFPDPAQIGSTFTFQTGSQGNLATYSKSRSDTQIYNHVLVTGSAGDLGIPVYAEAFNNSPQSSTRIGRIGDRLYQYDSTFLTTTAQCQATANSFLAYHALEDFTLSFSGIVIFWLEVGQVVTFVDPRPAAGDPINRNFLLSSISLPLGLGTMSAGAKRVVLLT